LDVVVAELAVGYETYLTKKAQDPNYKEDMSSNYSQRDLQAMIARVKERKG
jgi:hypothetical protein